MDKHMIDSHKLIFHPRRVADWQEGKFCFPINLEVGLTGACNHRCIFCSIDHMEYKPDILPAKLIMNTFKDLTSVKNAGGGVKSVLFAGNGEPLIHPDFVSIVQSVKKLGIDAALSTNGVLFNQEIINASLESLSWIRFSVSAGSEQSYKKIHRSKDGDFSRVMKNISLAAKTKQNLGCHTTLNVQIVMIPDNVGEIVSLAKQVKECGADIFVVKSFGLTSNIKTNLKNEITEAFYQEESQRIAAELALLNDKNFRTVFRSNRIEHEFSERTYNECLASDFHACISADGTVYPCCCMLGMDLFSFGNLHEDSFIDIWKSGKRKSVLSKLRTMNLSPCPKACKLDSMNRYLYQLIHPDEHVNFI